MTSGPPPPPGPAASLTVTPLPGLPEVRAGDDLAELVATAARSGEVGGLRDGDVLVVTSKVVSKAEGRTRPGDREVAVDEETDRVLARRGGTRIVRTRHGLVLAAAGVDASNVAPGSVVLLPEDPDASARRLRDRLAEVAGADVAVVVSDTAGRAWRTGQTDIAVGVAGLPPLVEHAGASDAHGNPLVVTAPALADEVAAAGDLVKGKLAGRPVALVRGLAHLVLPRGEHGPGAAALVRPEGEDMFGLGAREAVLAALGAGPGRPVEGFGAPAAAEEGLALLEPLLGPSPALRHDGDELVVTPPPLPPQELGAWQERLRVAAVALGWTFATAGAGGPVRLRPAASVG